MVGVGAVTGIGIREHDWIGHTTYMRMDRLCSVSGGLRGKFLCNLKRLVRGAGLMIILRVMYLGCQARLAGLLEF